jgi:uncharacterized membrane protein
MHISWTTPSALWLLSLIPLVWVALRFSRTNFNPRQRVVQAIVRSLLLALVVLALARPVMSAGSSKLSVVYLVDVSTSIAPAEIAQAADKIDALNTNLQPAYSRIVVFGANAGVIDGTPALRTLGTRPAGKAEAQSDIDRSGTDLESALATARASLDPGALPRIVLFTDGRSTAGDINTSIARLHATGVPVSVFPMAPADIGDTWIDGIALPDRVSAGATTPVTVHVSSQKDGSAVVELSALGHSLAKRTVAVKRPGTDVVLDAVFTTEGAQSVQASVAMPADPVKQNDTLERAMFVSPKPRVLYVEGAGAASSRYLNGALVGAGIDVALQAPGAPITADTLAPFDVAILSDVSRASMTDSQMQTMADWVEGGGGLLIAGGENVFGEGEQGYRKTELERIAPVTFERRDEPEVALVIVLDKSYSMNGSVMELCKAAAQAAIDALTDRQSVGVITFNDGFTIDVPLQNVGKNREKIRSAVSAIAANGQTLIFPAIEQAFKSLVAVKARAKHVVVLSDGRTYPDDYETLVKKMVEAKITVSSIAVGRDADAVLLGNIARWGHGRTYAVEDAHEVPQIFVKEAKDVPNLSFDEKPLDLVVKHQAFLEGIDIAGAPALRGMTATVPKDSAIELLATKDGDSLLSFWQVGLGRSAVFGSDVKDRWATDWVRWRGYGPFFSAVVHALQRQRPSSMALTVNPGVIHGATRAIDVSVDARDAAGRPRDFLSPQVRVQSGTKPPVEIAARQTAPGHYEGRAIIDADQTFAATVVGEEGSVSSAFIVPDVNAELRLRAPDDAGLRTIAAGTGGTFAPDAQSLASRPDEHRATRRPLWPALLWTALALWLADLALRRVRIFEPV